VRFQTPLDAAVLNLDNPLSRGFRRDTPGEVLFFSMSGDTPGDGAFIRVGGTFAMPAAADEERIIWRRHGQEADVLGVREVPLRGRHNVENVLAATAVAGACGIPMSVVAAAVRDFHGVPHRLEEVATANGVTYVNDSIATAPERTLAGLRAFAEPVVLLLGGRDKNLPLDELAAEAARRCRAVLCFGEAGDLFAAAVHGGAGEAGPWVERLATLDEAVRRAADVARPGDVVLLAPAGTSFDAYANFERRGEHFRQLVNDLADAPPQSAIRNPQSAFGEGL
jgi:UDP-N-acetylmuramoylalanine--D-glutamate ligase